MIVVWLFTLYLTPTYEKQREWWRDMRNAMFETDTCGERWQDDDS